jgi:NDP-sugar pyrophosphorylase family protein
MRKRDESGCGMIAIVLAGGYATRLGSLAKKTPKPLLPAGGKPILNHILEQLNSAEEITETIITVNT